MRIFIGIKLDNAVHQEVESFLKPFKKIKCPVRWVKPANIHITLKFIGEMDQKKYSQMEASFNKLTHNKNPLDIELTGCGKFGRENTINIFWIGIKTNPQLEQLCHKIEDALDKIGIAKESRDFKAHITVGRNKKNFNCKPFFNLIDQLGHEPISQFTTDRFQVFKSDLQPVGPIYSILKEIPLTNAGT